MTDSNALPATLESILVTLRAGGDPRVAEFAQALFARHDAEEFARLPAERWAAMARHGLETLQQRTAGEPLVRIHTPQGSATRSMLEIANDDMPFLVDSISNALMERGVGVHGLAHPVLNVRRDAQGALEALGEGERESFIQVEIDRQEPDAARRLEGELTRVLGDVRASVRDWPAMRAKMLTAADTLASQDGIVGAEAVAEAQEFLRWAADDHFTFLGYREYVLEQRDGEAVLAAVDATGLGILEGTDTSRPRSLTSLGAHALHAAGLREPLILSKTSARATVHRRGYMDYIGVMEYDAQGRPVRERRFLGLFTSSAYNRRPWEIPLVRSRFEQVMRESNLPESGHSAKTLRHVLETLPRDELFHSSADELKALGEGLLGLQERPDARLFLRRDRYGRFHSVLVYVPRERFNTQIRARIEEMLKAALNADTVDSHVTMGDSPLAQLHMIVRPRIDTEMPDVDSAPLQAQLDDIVRDWHDALGATLIERHGDEAGVQMARQVGRVLPAGYIEAAGVEAAADDAAMLAMLSDDAPLAISLRSTGVTPECADCVEVKLFNRGGSLPLSQVLPMLEHMGLKVMNEHPTRVQLGGGPASIQELDVRMAPGMSDPGADSEAFVEAFTQVWNGSLENDGFNRLVLAAHLGWKQVAMLRAYCKYLLQIGVPFSQGYMEGTLARYPLLARLLVEYFEARFFPGTGNEGQEALTSATGRLTQDLDRLCSSDEAARQAVDAVIAARGGARDARMQAAEQAILALMDRVKSLDEDRILRAYLGVMQATLRTNYYVEYAQGRRADGGPADYLSFKLDSNKVPELPKPRPYREIWVCGPRVEGIHLRFGPVARGGLRWSDRREDFRTEVLGLVKAQMVKNTVIVPVGSKGGFFAKQLPDMAVDRDAWFNEGVACYKRFINGLLELTDNIVEGVIVPPQGVVRHDQDDPYLVVAADKGTATFSDIANSIAQAHGFWLDDAFASGGSVGYDHKGMGITARGAWESVKRHFRALGRDCQTEDFTCVGIGDMSGDVFGNGMLLSRHIRLVAAFDHRHIFLDPNPDAARSFAERTRLFALPRSSWDDYDKSLISAGGGVFARSEKSIALSPEIRAALGIEGDAGAMSPAELMGAILKSPVDLLWNGGIGTYVKSSRESNADVGDRANNALRVNGADLRCKVVGEGGNLGMTQLGRVEAAQHGVLLNTDFIDNSAGVDTSDHEVNIKILLNGEVQQSRLKLEDRNTLLASMTDEVAGLVLNDNYRQNQTLTLMQRMAQTRLGSKLHFLRTLEAQGLLDREVENLPSEPEIAERKAKGLGLTRPELSVLLSYAKLVAYPQLLASDVPEDAYLSKELERYFPQPLRERYAQAMQDHRLKREIIATAVTNSTINRMGATFLMRMQEDSGRDIGEIAKAYTISRETLNARELWNGIDALDGKVAETAQIDALMVIWELQRGFTRWLLSRPGAIPDITTAVARYHDGFRDIRAGADILTSAQRPGYEASRAAWREKGFPAELADQMAALPYLDAAPNIIELSNARGVLPVEVAKVHFRLADALREPWLRQQVEALKVDGRWHAVARGVLREELATQMRKLTEQALAMPGDSADAKVAAWLARDDASLRFTLQMLDELAAQKVLDYPTVSVAVQRLAQLADRG